MLFSSQDLIDVLFGAIVPQMREGQQVGALAPNVPDRPHIEWAYRVQDDTLIMLLFNQTPSEYAKPDDTIQVPGFCRLCMAALEGGAAIVKAVGGCGDPNCTECGGGSKEGRPLDSGGGFMGFTPNPKPDEEDRIGFRPPGQ